MSKLRFTKDAAELVMAYILIVTGAGCAWAVFGQAEIPTQLKVIVLLFAPPWAVSLYQFLFGMETARQERKEGA
jgi:hypothetical protein